MSVITRNKSSGLNQVDDLVFTPKDKDANTMIVKKNNTTSFQVSVNNVGELGVGNSDGINQKNSISIREISSLERELINHGHDDSDTTELKQLVGQPIPT